MWPLGVLKKPDLSVLLNLRFEGANGSQVFTDSSPFARSVTVSTGTPALTTTNPLSGTSSLLLGTNGTLTTPNFTNPVSNYIRTIEFRIQIDLADIANNESQGVFAKGFSSSIFQDYSHQCILTRNPTGPGGVLGMYWYTPVLAAPSMLLQVPLSDISQNNHVAFTQRPNNIYVSYLQGLFVGSSAFVQTYQQNPYNWDFGVSVYNWATSTQTNKFKGRLDNFRLCNVDKYPTNFTPPA